MPGLIHFVLYSTAANAVKSNPWNVFDSIHNRSTQTDIIHGQETAVGAWQNYLTISMHSEHYNTLVVIL